MKGRVPTFDHLYHIPSLLMARKYLSLFKKPQNDLARTIIGCEVFDPLRISESQSTTRKAAAVEKVFESVNQAVSSSNICSESIINLVETNMKSVTMHSFSLKW